LYNSSELREGLAERLAFGSYPEVITARGRAAKDRILDGIVPGGGGKLFTSITKRAVRTPQVYFLDTGLAAWLTRWNTPAVLQNVAMAGAFFETWVVAEILKSWLNEDAADFSRPLFATRTEDRRQPGRDSLHHLPPAPFGVRTDPADEALVFQGLEMFFHRP